MAVERGVAIQTKSNPPPVFTLTAELRALAKLTHGTAIAIAIRG
jgi:hypothetical protein